MVGPLYFEQQGATGRPMVFLHSTPDDHRLWLHQTAHFSAWYRTIAIDQAGYGRSPAVRDGVTLEDQAAACWDTIDRVSSDAIILHGNSMGAGVARVMVLQRPARVAALILSGTGYRPDGAAIQLAWKKRYQQEGIGLRHHQVLDHFSEKARQWPLVQHYARMVVALNNEGTLASIIAMNQALAGGMSEETLARIAAPTLIICGTEDRTYPSAIELQKRIRGAQFAAIEGSGHACNFETPWEYDRHCIAFLQRLGLYDGPAREEA